jgi:hypothetical protein
MANYGRRKKKAPKFYKECKLCEVGFAQAVKSIEDTPGETRASAIRQLQKQMVEFAGLAERSIKALRHIADRQLGKDNKFPKREEKTPQPADIIDEKKSKNSKHPQPAEIIDNDESEDEGTTTWDESEDEKPWVEPKDEDPPDDQWAYGPGPEPEPDEYNGKKIHHRSEQYKALYKARRKAQKYLGVYDFRDLNDGTWPPELVSMIKKAKSRKFHPDTGGSDKKYQKFLDALDILEEDVEINSNSFFKN